MREAVDGRVPEATPLAVRLAEQRHPLSGLRDGTGQFLRTVRASPALLGRMREVGEELEGFLAGLLADNGVARPALVAALTVAAYRIVATRSVERILDGEGSATIVDDHVAALHTAFDALDAAADVLPPHTVTTGPAPQ